MSAVNHIKNVAIVGAGGNVGSYITRSLLETGKHVVTAITRNDSQTKLPNGVIVKSVDYSEPDTLVEALRGQDALVITLSGHAPIQEIEEKLVRACGAAGVRWILPNEWAPDSANEGIVRDVFLFGMKVATRKLIEDLGECSYVAMVTGFWYEYSLAIPFNYGFDFAKRTVDFYDEGETRISTSTWPQVGRAVAAVLSLPIQRDGPDQELSLQDLQNKVVYINSFTVSQKEMLESVLRVTGTGEQDWTVTKRLARESFATGMADMKAGKRPPSANFLYSRIFFDDGCGDFEKKGTLNDSLGLPKEDIDKATKVAIDRFYASR